jgi:SAM-dependent methyltransferase
MTPQAYEAWYHTARGDWIAEREFARLMRMLQPAPGARLLDVGCGTGHFSRRFAGAGLHVTGLDPDDAMLAFARKQNGAVDYLCGDARALPFTDRSFDHCAAITSLCFIDDPVRALKEMLRVASRSIVLGLLNRHSRLYRQKYGRGGYQGARWDSADDVRRWVNEGGILVSVKLRSAVFYPGGNLLARLVEHCLPTVLLRGGFLVAGLSSAGYNGASSP